MELQRLTDEVCALARTVAVFIREESRAFTEAQVEILDEKGSLVYTESLTTGGDGQYYELSLRQLPAGIYFAKISWPEGRRTKKFIVSR